MVAVALIAGPVQAAASQQFDLVCKVTPDSGSPSSKRLHIDLGAMEWCTDECKMVRKIAEVTSDYITLQQPDSESAWHYGVSRIDGKGTMWNERLPTFNESFVCQKAPFSPMPKAAF